jgi:hypothetical protein
MFDAFPLAPVRRQAGPLLQTRFGVFVLERSHPAPARQQNHIRQASCEVPLFPRAPALRSLSGFRVSYS